MMYENRAYGIQFVRRPLRFFISHAGKLNDVRTCALVQIDVHRNIDTKYTQMYVEIIDTFANIDTKIHMDVRRNYRYIR